MSEGSIYPGFVTPKWVADNLRIDNSTAKMIAEKLAKFEEGWGGVEDRASFAEAFLESHTEDPSIGLLCRKAIGANAPTLFKFPVDDEAPRVPDSAPAKKIVGYFAECARIAAERDEHGVAVERAVLEMLEYGEEATDAFELAHETQLNKDYAELTACAKEIEARARALVLVDKGLYPVEADGEANAAVARDYAIGKLRIMAAKAHQSEDKLAGLQEVAATLADAAGATAAHMQISTAPLATVAAIATLTESVGIIEQQQKGADDENLDKGAAEAHAAAEACKDYLVDRQQACEARLKAEEVAESAKRAAAEVKTAAAMPVTNMADMKKMQEVFLKANKAALEACSLATECAKYISTLREVKPNDEAADALFAQIEQAFRGARTEATREVAEQAKQASVAQAQAKELSDQLRESAMEQKEEEPAAAQAGVDAEEARERLLKELETFSKKRWDTDLATQTLRRLVDRRKEAVGQLWEAVETRDDSAPKLVAKFVDQFDSTMAARRRLDAVVRMLGRGENLDPRKSKWFIEGILKISDAAAVYLKAL